MSETYDTLPTSRCFGCLTSNNERRLQTYFIKKLMFKMILQMEQLVLCYICKRVAVQTERFIHNVETVQALFADSKQNICFPFENYKMPVQPLMDLSWKIHDTIVLGGETVEEYKTDDIKLEEADFAAETAIKEELELLNSDENSFYHDADYQINDEISERPRTKKHMKKKTRSKNNLNAKGVEASTEKDFSDNISGEKQIKDSLKEFCSKIVNLTKEQVLEERILKASEAKYMEAAFKCEHCIKGFIMKTPYENHMRLHDKNRGEYECDICTQRMETKLKLEHHYRYHIERYQCSKCPVSRNCWVSLKDHYLRKHEDTAHYQYTCPVCYKLFRFRGTMQKHKNSAHSARERLKCKHCDHTFGTESALANHLRFKHVVEESVQVKRYSCSMCPRSYRRLQLLKRHLASHSADRDHYCVECDKYDECDKSFKTRSALTTHLKTTNVHLATKDNTDIKFACEQCGRSFVSQKALKRHAHAVHVLAAHGCARCGKSFKSAAALRSHGLQHAGAEGGPAPPKRHACAVCNKRFHEKHVLSKHMNIHTGARPFRCPQCPAQFAHSGSLYNHTRLVHLRLTRRGLPRGKGRHDHTTGSGQGET